MLIEGIFESMRVTNVKVPAPHQYGVCMCGKFLIIQTFSGTPSESAYGVGEKRGNSEEVCTTLHCGEDVIRDREMLTKIIIWL